jgi:hypothetical protein
VQNICNVKLERLGRSIQPLVTKCRPGQEDLDIEVLRGNLVEFFENDFLTQMVESREDPPRRGKTMPRDFGPEKDDANLADV